MQIAGDRTCNDWKILRDSLEKNPHNWSDAYEDFFLERLTTRYFAPIKRLQDPGGNNGEGFSIVSIQCALIEFLQTTRDGMSFKKGSPNGSSYCNACEGKDSDWTYENCSKKIFTLFLTKQLGIEVTQSKDFYSDVRCSLLHEARTTGNWRITANPKRSETISVDGGVTYLQRDLFQKDLEAYVWRYKVDLLSDEELQKAFIRKFNSLCV